MNLLPWPVDPLRAEAAAPPVDLRLADVAAGEAFFAVCLPPPVHGQSLVNASVARAATELGGAGRVEICDIGPGANKFGLQYHLTRVSRVLGAAARLLRGGRRPGRRFYTVFESGFGVGYNFLLVGLARLLGHDVVLHHHTSEHAFVRQGRFALLQKLMGPRGLNVALSEEMAENLRILYPDMPPIMVSHNACHIAPPDDLAPRAPRDGGKLRVGFLSNLCREKGLDVVLDVAGKCRARGLDVTFVFAGPTVGEEAASMLAEGREKLGDMIEAIGRVDKKAKEDFFRSIDVFLFPTRYRYEAQPLVLLEAMSFGLRPVTTNCGFVAELVGRYGAVFEPDEYLSEMMADELQRLVEAPQSVRTSADDVRGHFMRLRARAGEQLRQLTRVLLSARPAAREADLAVVVPPLAPLPPAAPRL